MKKFFTKAGRVCKTVAGGLFALTALLYIVLAITEPELRAVMLVMAGVFGLLAFFLLRRKKAGSAPDQTAPGAPLHETQVDAPLFSVTTTSNLEVPEGVLRDMRRCYKKPQAVRDAEIMRESFYLAQNTTDIEVFTSRVELARKKAITLKQAQMAKCKGIKSLHAEKAIEAVLGSTQSLKIDFLFRTYEKETQSAMQLKTPRGQRNRLEKFLAKLHEHEDDFLEAKQQYDEVLDMVQNMMPETEKAGEV